MSLFFSYLKRQRKVMLLILLFFAVVALMFYLYDLPPEPALYALALCLFFGLLLFGIGFNHYVKRHDFLTHLAQNPEEAASRLPPPRSLLEQDYQTILYACSENHTQIMARYANDAQEMTDYYTLWAHQIKTPIAAMHLLLQEETFHPGLFSTELSKVEEYVEMALSYLRLNSESSDYLLRRYDLDAIVRSCVRKHAKLFILKQIDLDFQETDTFVLTDEKWLSFVIGQLLSNALKYTANGGRISISLEAPATLVIADNGIGIDPSDLPRVFEKGFTGHNGRTQQKSTGIGLYLCKRVLAQLGHTISITSAPGRGTQVRLDLAAAPQVIE